MTEREDNTEEEMAEGNSDEFKAGLAGVVRNLVEIDNDDQENITDEG